MALVDTGLSLWATILVVAVIAVTAIVAFLGSTLASAGVVFVLASLAAIALYYIGIRADAWLGGSARRGY